MKWLVTGGCGFIGINLVKQLYMAGGHFIRIVDNLLVGSKQDLSSVCQFSEAQVTDLSLPFDTPSSAHVELVVGDILDRNLAARAAQGVDIIVHLAANTGVGPSVEDPHSDCLVNIIGTLNYLEAARHTGVNRFIFASSGASIGECEPPIHEELAPHPVSPYGASKLAGEGYCSVYFRTFGIKTVVLRFGNIYGTGSNHKTSVVAKFIRQAMHGEVLEIYGDGTQTRDFIYIDDLVRAIQLVATIDGIGGEIFQIATNSETTVNELVDKLLSVLADADIHDVKVHHGASRLGDVRRNFSDISKAKLLLGWQAEAGLTDGLKRTVQWFIGQTEG